MIVVLQAYTLDEVKEVISSMPAELAGDKPLNARIKSNWVLTEACKGAADLIPCDPIFKGSRSWMLSSPTTPDRVIRFAQ